MPVLPTGSVGGPAGSVVSGHDALYTYPADMQTNGTLISGNGTDTNLPRVTLADAATQRVKGVWAIPVGWKAMAVRYGWVNEVATAGNVKFQFTYDYIHLGEGDVTGAVTATVTFGARTAGGQFDWNYETAITELATIPVVLGAFGDSPFMMWSLSRLGADGTDTLAGGASIGVVTATRVDP